MERRENGFCCAQLPRQAVEAIQQYEAELQKLTGKELVLVAYEENKK